MKQTNYQPIDFLDLDPSFPGTEHIWKVGRATDMVVKDNVVVVTIPFQIKYFGLRSLLMALTQCPTALCWSLRQT